MATHLKKARDSYKCGHSFRKDGVKLGNCQNTILKYDYYWAELSTLTWGRKMGNAVVGRICLDCFKKINRIDTCCDEGKYESEFILKYRGDFKSLDFEEGVKDLRKWTKQKLGR